MSDDIKSAMLNEGDTTSARHNESLESVSGQGDETAVPADRNGPSADANIEQPSRTATAPSVEADAEDDPQAPGKARQG